MIKVGAETFINTPGSLSRDGARRARKIIKSSDFGTTVKRWFISNKK